MTKEEIFKKHKLNGGDMKSVHGDSGHVQMKMVADVYSHISVKNYQVNHSLKFWGLQQLSFILS